MRTFKDATAEKIISHFDGQLAQLVVCDGAPDGFYFLLGYYFRVRNGVLQMLSSLEARISL